MVVNYSRFCEAHLAHLAQRTQSFLLLKLFSFVLACVILSVPTVAQTEAQETTHVISLADGSIGYGRLLPNSEDGQVNFSVDGFVTPFAFPQSSIRSVRKIPSETEKPKKVASNTWLFRLRDRQQIVGEIKSLTSESLVVLTAHSGELTVPRNQLLRIERSSQSGDLVKGVIRADEWKDPNDSKLWKVNANRISTSSTGVRLVADFSLPVRSEIRLSIRWNRKPNFAINLGVDSKTPANDAQNQWGVPAGHKLPTVGKKRTFASIETWAEDLAFVRESEGGSMIKNLGQLTGNSCNLTLFLDISAGLAVAQTSDGKLHKLTAPSTMIAGKLQALEIQNFGGSISIESFEVCKWNGQLPIEFAEKSGLVKRSKDGDLQAIVDGWNAESKSWLLSAENEVSTLPENELVVGTVSIEKPIETPTETSTESPNASQIAKAEPANEASSVTTADEPAPQVQVSVVTNDGSRLLGSIMKSNTDAIEVKSLATSSIVSIPVAEIREINVASPIASSTAAVAKESPTHATALIATTGLSEIRGTLLSDLPDARTTALVWQPSLALNASELDYERSGEISSTKFVPKEIEPTEEPNASSTPQAQPQAGGFLQLFGIAGGAPANANQQPKPDKKKTGDNVAKDTGSSTQIRFRSGDSAPAKILLINESGVRFESERTSTTFAPDTTIDQIVFRTLKKESITPEQRKRLLTVPRAQQNDPPTHLLISTAGDFLRGRLLEANQQRASIDVRGEILEFPIEEIAEIIWLYNRDWKTPKEKSETVAEPKSENNVKTMVYAVLGKDQGMAIIPKSVVNSEILGKSELLGDSRIKLPDLLALYWGPNTSEKARALRSKIYALTLAQQPRDTGGDESGGGTSSGSNAHPLVGKPAPEFGLKNLKGESIQLKKLGGQIIVLDFWASWCGPCMQAMPQLEQMMGEFDQSRVRLLAINIQESKSKIELALKRLNIEPEVLLDVDGEIAASYSANAIPQTVIIDPSGTVSHVFVGGGNQVLNQIRQALNEQLEVTRN